MKTIKQLNLIGFYQAHDPVDADDLVADPRTGELVKMPSMTKQSFKDECDINNIVRKFEATGNIDHVNQAAAKGLYVDLPDGLDLQTGLNMIKQAEAAFMALPAATRAEFDNDPVKFVEAFNNPSEQQLRKFADLGLVTIDEPPAEQSGPKAAPTEPATKPEK